MRWALFCFCVAFLSDSFEGGGLHGNLLFSSLFKQHNVESEDFRSHLHQRLNAMHSLKALVSSSLELTQYGKTGVGEWVGFLLGSRCFNA